MMPAMGPRRGGKRPGAGRPPGALNKITRPIKELAADHSHGCIERLVHLSKHAESEQVRLVANIAILDRAHGRPRQELGLTHDNQTVVIVNRNAARTTPEDLPIDQQCPALEDLREDENERRWDSPM